MIDIHKELSLYKETLDYISYLAGLGLADNYCRQIIEVIEDLDRELTNLNQGAP